MEKQTVSLSFDKDTGILDMRLLTGEHYYVTNPLHARRIKEKVSLGGRLNTAQVDFLEQYRVRARETNKTALLAKVRKLREELRPK